MDEVQNMIPEVVQLLDKIKSIHEKKNEDYAAQGKQFENFTRAAELITWFNHNEDKAFVNHIATKLARLATLLNSNGEPNNESIDDSFLDLATYCILWAAYHTNQKHAVASIFKECHHDWTWNIDGTNIICTKCRINQHNYYEALREIKY